MGPKVSIITVVRNDAENLKNTIKSIKHNSYRNIEYIIIDGASHDCTIEIIKSNEPYISKWISEPDNGLYHAMNKGLKMAAGDYVMFLNAGDILNNDEVLNNVFSSSANEADIYYGETIIINEQGKEIGMRRLKTPKILSWRSMKNGMVVCHQSIIVKRSIVPAYNTKFRIASDYLWVLQCLKKAKVIINTNITISRFLDGGMNKSNITRALKERFFIMVKEFGLVPTLLQHLIIAVKFIFYLFRYRRF